MEESPYYSDPENSGNLGSPTYEYTEESPYESESEDYNN